MKQKMNEIKLKPDGDDNLVKIDDVSFISFESLYGKGMSRGEEMMKRCGMTCFRAFQRLVFCLFISI